MWDRIHQSVATGTLELGLWPAQTSRVRPKEGRLKTRLLLTIGFILAGFWALAIHTLFPTYGVIAPEVTYDSPAGQFKLPTEDRTAGTLGVDYKLAAFFFGVPKTGPLIGDLNGNTGNGFKDRYDYENLNSFSLAQAGNNVGDLDSLDPTNAVPGPGGRAINPGFRFVHLTDQPFIWRIGEATDNQQAQQVIVFPSIDHLLDPEVPGYGPHRQNPPVGGLGNVVLEALEFTLWGTNDQTEAIRAAQTPNYFGVGGTGLLPANGKWVRGVLLKVLAEGFKDYNGLSPFANRPEGFTPSPQEGDDFASVWEFRDQTGNPVAVKYVAAYANRTRDARFFVPDSQGRIPGNTALSFDAEIDAIAFVPAPLPRAESSLISGRVINDLNGNGMIDAGEQPIPGVRVSLFDSTGASLLAVATTDVQGGYLFQGLAAGSYQVVETNPPGYLDTGAIPGAGSTLINANTISVTLGSGQISAENNFLDTLPPFSGCTPACFIDSMMWTIGWKARLAAYAKAGGISNIFILSLNRGAASDEEVVAVLEDFGTAQAALDREFVTAQLNAFSYPGSVFNRATCFFNGPNIPLKLPGNPRLIDVLNSARSAFASGNPTQIRTATFLLTMFNNTTATTGIQCTFADP